VRRLIDQDDNRRCAHRLVGLYLGVAIIAAGCASSDAASAPTRPLSSTTTTQFQVPPIDALPEKQAVDVIKAMFTQAGLASEGPADVSTQLRIPVCPFGSNNQLTAPPAPAGIANNPIFTLERQREPIIGIRCTFNDSPATPTTEGTTAATSKFLQYQVWRIPGDQLSSYLKQLDNESYERSAQRAFGGVVYTHCAGPHGTTVTVVGYSDCGAIWLTGVIAVGLRFTGPNDAPLNIPQWLVDQIPSIITTLAAADPASIGGQQIGVTTSSTPST
jgi:hypothetical protein